MQCSHPVVGEMGISSQESGAIRAAVSFRFGRLSATWFVSEWLVILPQWATANRERQGALTESRTTIAGDPFYREWLCGAGQGYRGRILEGLYIDNCLPSTVEFVRQLAFSF